MSAATTYFYCMRIDLNCDLGETVQGVATGDDAAMFPLISSANIACGHHAGDDAAMRSSCELAARYGVAVGAHVSYFDLANFGRTDLEPADSELADGIFDQLQTLQTHAAAAGVPIRYVKPHGALYNRIACDEARANIVAAALAAFRPGIPMVGLPGSAAQQAAAEHGLAYLPEAFADRGYRADGTLVPRTETGALVPASDAPARVVRMVKDGVVRAVDGSDIAVQAVTVCIHGDSPGAVAMAIGIRKALDTNKIAVLAAT